MPSSVALIPARGGSKRVPGKNVRPLAGHPLIAYTVSAALESGEFDKVLVSSDDPATLEIAHSYGADALRRPDQFATDTSPDIEWVSHALSVLGGSARYETFSILRPTSPFRTPATISRAFAEWRAAHQHGERYSSLRAVEPCAQRPEKMWRIHGKELVPLLLQPGRPSTGSGWPPAAIATPSPVIRTVPPGVPTMPSGIPAVPPVIPTEAEGSHRASATSISHSSKPFADERSDPSVSVGMTGGTAEMTKSSGEVIGSRIGITKEGETAEKGKPTQRDTPALSPLAGESWREGESRSSGPTSPVNVTQAWHDSQAASLPPIYIQNASLEIAWTHTVEATGTISGPRVLPFLTRDHEGFDVNTELDWALAELLLERGEVTLPSPVRHAIAS